MGGHQDDHSGSACLNRIRKRVAIICGSGSGLIAAREMITAGVGSADIVIFGKSGDVGGVFSSSYQDLQITSGNLSSFGCFPAPANLAANPKYWTCEEYHAYLAAFATCFGLFSLIRFHTEVISMKKTTGDLVAVSTVSSSHGMQTFNSYLCQHVVLCSGTVCQGFGPRLQQIWVGTLLSDYQSQFEGEVVHSVSYRGARQFTGKRVLVVGAGETGSDVSLQVAKVACAKCMSVRRGPGSLIPRVVYGMPSDSD